MHYENEYVYNVKINFQKMMEFPESDFKDSLMVMRCSLTSYVLYTNVTGIIYLLP